MPVGEVLSSDPPATPHADHDRAEVVDGKCDHPHRDARVALEEACHHEQRGSEDRGWGEPKKIASQGVPFGPRAARLASHGRLIRAVSQLRATQVLVAVNDASIPTSVAALAVHLQNDPVVSQRGRYARGAEAL
jgi:hypothetical protein